MSNGNRRWKIDPNKTAMENLYDAANTACRYMLSRSKVQLKSNEERRELLDLCIYKGVEMFLEHYIHGEKKYNRAFTFFENVYGACRSCFGHAVDYYLREIRRRISTTDHMETLAYNQDRHPLRAELNHHYYTEITEVERASLDYCKMSPMVAEDALKYIWACEDEANEFDHKTIDYAATREHRAQILQRVRDMVNGNHSEEFLKRREYNRKYHRKRRANAKAAARNLSSPPGPGPSPRPSLGRDK